MTVHPRDRPRRVLFLLFEGLPPTVIDSQVLHHARTMKERGCAEFEIWTFACTDELYAAAVHRQAYAEALAGCPVRVFRGLRPAAPGSQIWNGARIARELVRQSARFDLIHARTDYSVMCAVRGARASGTPVLWDCRGDSVAEFRERYQPQSRLGRALVKWKSDHLHAQRQLAGRACSGAFFVSKPLTELCAEALGDKPSWIIPCVASEQHFYFDPALRARTRAALGYSDATRLFVYSGTLAAYQCFDETIALFADIHSRDQNARLLVLTPAIEAARHRLSALPEGVAAVMSVPLEAVNDYLNAADVAFLLRAHTDVNRAASPTKLAEYCLSGLPVVMTDAIPDGVRLTGQLGNRLSPNAEALCRPFAVDRPEVARRARKLVGRSAIAPQIEEAYEALFHSASGATRSNTKSMKCA